MVVGEERSYEFCWLSQIKNMDREIGWIEQRLDCVLELGQPHYKSHLYSVYLFNFGQIKYIFWDLAFSVIIQG